MNRAITVAAAAAGLVAYVYLLGGIVVWLHLTTAQLPADTGTGAVSSRRLLAVGCRVAAFEILLLVAVSILVTIFVGIAINRRGEIPKRPASNFTSLAAKWSHLWTLGGMIGPAFAWLLFVLGLSVEGLCLRVILLVGGALLGIIVATAMVLRAPRNTGEGDPCWQRQVRRIGIWVREGERLKWVKRTVTTMLAVNSAVAIFVIPVLQGVILLAGTAVIYAGAFLRWPSSGTLSEFRSELVTSSGVWVSIAAATVVALAWVATPPVSFQGVTVWILDGESQHGAYIDRSSEGIFLGKCKVAGLDDSHPRSRGSQIEFIPSAETTGFRLGGESYAFDSGSRPSLAEVIAAGVGGGSAAHEHAPIDHALRGRPKHVCGEPEEPGS